MPRRSGSVVVITLALAWALTGCGGGSGAEEGSPATGEDPAVVDVAVLDPCSTINLTTVIPAQLTVATTDRRDLAWLSQNDRDEWVGREADEVYAIAQTLGFTAPQVTWLEDTFTPETFVAEEPADLLVGQVSAREMAAVGGESTIPFATFGQSALVMGVLPGNPLRTCIDQVMIEIESSGQRPAS